MASDRRLASLAGYLAVALLAGGAYLLRAALQIQGALDVDAVNLGLAALRFDLLEFRPHPPGFPGYVLLLKLIHGVAPQLSALELARIGGRLCGAATVPAAFWVTRLLMARDAATPAAALLRPLAAAALAALTPLLWYYGGDGQSHAAEGLVLLALLGLTVQARHRGTTAWLVLAAAALALAGGVRPNITLLASPLALWLLWGRAWRDWLLAAVVAAGGCAAWLVPLVHLCGGWELYSRASGALYSFYVDTYSVFGRNSSASTIMLNVDRTLWALIFSAAPLLAWSGVTAAWRRPWLAVMGLNVAAYGLVYIAEPGYLTGVAALLCLVPAGWPAAPSRLLWGRAALALSLGPLLVLAGPADVPRLLGPGREMAPTLAHVMATESGQRSYAGLVCGAAGGRPALLVTDNPVLTHTRLLPHTCPGLQVGLLLLRMPLNPRLEAWLVLREGELDTLPTPIPLEPGPPAKGALARPVVWVIIAPEASHRLRAAVRKQASCAPRLLPGGLHKYRARCLPRLQLGQNVLKIPQLAE